MELPPLKKSYGSRIVLDFPGLTLEEGTICAVIGANGSGKSTLSRLLAGVLSPDGSVSPSPMLPSVGYMPQKPYAFRMSVRKNLLLSGCTEEAAGAMEERLSLKALSRARADRLSGGETARMALARVLLGQHSLLILDEPTAAMDMESAAISEGLIREYCRSGGHTVLLVTHDLQQARRLADYALFFREGRLVEHGPATKLLFSPAKSETRHFLDFYAGTNP